MNHCKDSDFVFSKNDELYPMTLFYWITRPFISLLLFLVFFGLTEYLTPKSVALIQFCYILGFLTIPVLQGTNKVVREMLHNYSDNRMCGLVILGGCLLVLGEALIRESIPKDPIASLTGFSIGCLISYYSSTLMIKAMRIPK